VASVTRYQFQVDGRAANFARDRWKDAAYDAVNAGYATWGSDGQTIYLDDSQGAEIARVEYPVAERVQSSHAESPA